MWYPNVHPFIDSEAVPDWLQSLIGCCCYTGSFDIQAIAIGTLLDLVNVSHTVLPGYDKKPVLPAITNSSTTSTSSGIMPLIAQDSLQWLERSNLYRVSIDTSGCCSSLFRDGFILDTHSQRAGSYKIGAVIVNV